MTIQFDIWNVVTVVFVSSLMIFLSRVISGFIHALLKKVYNSASKKIDVFCDLINKHIEENDIYKRENIGFVDRSSK